MINAIWLVTYRSAVTMWANGLHKGDTAAAADYPHVSTCRGRDQFNSGDYLGHLWLERIRNGSPSVDPELLGKTPLVIISLVS